MRVHVGTCYWITRGAGVQLNHAGAGAPGCAGVCRDVPERRDVPEYAGMCRSAGVCRMCRVPGRINHQKHLVWMGFGVYVDEYFCQGSAIHNNLIQ